MKQFLLYFLLVSFLSGFTSFFGGMPVTWNEFLFGFGVCFLFWGGMLAPILSE